MSCWCPLCTVQQPIFVGEEHISSLWSRKLWFNPVTPVRANWKNQKIQRIPSRAICSKQTTLSIAMRRFWIASCLAMLPNKLCSWRNKAASASYSPKRKAREARNRAKGEISELQDVSFKIQKNIHLFRFCPLRNSSTLAVLPLYYLRSQTSIITWVKFCGLSRYSWRAMFIQHDEVEPETSYKIGKNK